MKASYLAQSYGTAMAEGLAGSEEAFAELMNAKAKELGLNDSQFRKATSRFTDLLVRLHCPV